MVTRVISAVLAVPAFFLNAPAWVMAVEGFVIAATITALVLVHQQGRRDPAAQHHQTAEPRLAQQGLLDRPEVQVLEPNPSERTARGEPVGQLGGRLDLHTGIVSLGSRA